MNDIEVNKAKQFLTENEFKYDHNRSIYYNKDKKCIISEPFVNYNYTEIESAAIPRYDSPKFFFSDDSEVNNETKKELAAKFL